MTNNVTHAFVSAKSDDVVPGEIRPSHWNGGHVLDITGDSSWIAPTMTNGWAWYGPSYNTPGYRKDGQGFVHLKGLVKDGSLSAAIFTLPVGYRPLATCLFGTITSGNVGRVDVSADGQVQALSPSVSAWVSLEGIIFFADG
jgi:hypothetical protein